MNNQLCGRRVRADVTGNDADILSLAVTPQVGPSQAIRELEAKYDRPIGIMVDLQGPKHRVGMFPNPDAGFKVTEPYP